MVNVSTYLPAPELNNLIRQYWVMQMNPGTEGSEEIFFPVGAVEIIFHLQSRFTRISNGKHFTEKKAFIEGQQSGILLVKSSGAMKTIGITLYPWATTILYNIPPSFFTDTNFDAGDIDINLLQLYEQLYINDDNSLIPSICNSYFSAILKNKFTCHTPAEMEIMKIFKKHNDAFTIGELKKEWPYSTKLFEKKFKELTGLSAGELMKKRRMVEVLKNTLLQDYKSLTDVAHAAGYYDQSHFIKDFRTYFFTSPKLLKKDHRLLKHFI